VADGVDPAAALDAREAIDRTAAALAACACTTGAAPEEPTDGPTDGTTDGPTDGATDGATDGTTASDGAAAATGRDVLSPA
jgi:hypothetical protein